MHATLSHPVPTSSDCEFHGVSRVFAIGDLHGNYPGFCAILRGCGLIDGDDHWMGGDSHVVQLGDVFGRGGEPGKVLNLIKILDAEASAVGGRVHMLLGNHEILTLRGSILYNTPEEFADFARAGALPAFDEESSPEIDAGVPEKLRRRLRALGCWEFCRALLPGHPVGCWLRARPSVLVINDSLFVHGGLDPVFGIEAIEAINAQVRREIFSSPDWTPVRSLLGSDGPQWHRDYVLRPDGERAEALDRVLTRHGCRRMVVGHTPTAHLGRAGKVTPLYGGRLVCVDTGIGRMHGARLSALCLEGGAVTPVYPQAEVLY